MNRSITDPTTNGVTFIVEAVAREDSEDHRSQTHEALFIRPLNEKGKELEEVDGLQDEDGGLRREACRVEIDSGQEESGPCAHRDFIRMKEAQTRFVLT